MARSRKLSPERKEFINSLLEHYHPEDAQDVQEMLKDLLGDTLQGMLEAEMGKFEPQVVRKNQTDISNIEDQVLSMYAKGMTTRDISTHLRDVYGVEASAEMISHMTDRILPIAKEWQNRPLERKYAIVFMDAIHFHVREDNRTVKKAVYVAIDIRLNGIKEVLGMWIGGNESAKYWLGVLSEIKNRGDEDIMIVSVDGLTGFGDAISAVFPQTEIQRCIVHQIWGKKYPSSVASWKNNWSQLSTYFKYPAEIRNIIYTTNSIENFNRGLRKVTKAKAVFPTDDALFKSIYLAMMDITKKWTETA
ncbi:MAG: IS256 family transposase [Lachnospiraceae bacterium]|nr:IS256 family transposase [Lachnospiraceae bacterium]